MIHTSRLLQRTPRRFPTSSLGGLGQLDPDQSSSTGGGGAAGGGGASGLASDSMAPTSHAPSLPGRSAYSKSSRTIDLRGKPAPIAVLADGPVKYQSELTLALGALDAKGLDPRSLRSRLLLTVPFTQ
jgi:hypothetical protein